MNLLFFWLAAKTFGFHENLESEISLDGCAILELFGNLEFAVLVDSREPPELLDNHTFFPDGMQSVPLRHIFISILPQPLLPPLPLPHLPAPIAPPPPLPSRPGLPYCSLPIYSCASLHI